MDPAAGSSAQDGEVLVATDGSAAAAVAVRYALDLGADLARPVRIVHVVPDDVAVPDGLGPAIEGAGRDLLDDVVRRAHLAAPAVDLRSSLLRGNRTTELAAASERASLVVLGRSGRLTHLATGSTAAAVVAGARCAVRVVPPEWFQRGTRSEVLVGVKGVAEPSLPSGLLERGFAIADELGESLVLLHAWSLPSGYEEVQAEADAEAWTAQLAARLDQAATAARVRYPDVPYQVRVVPGRPARVLEAASRRASFLLLGRPSFPAYGDLTRVLANVGECPVEIAPVALAPTGPPAEADGPSGVPVRPCRADSPRS